VADTAPCQQAGTTATLIGGSATRNAPAAPHVAAAPAHRSVTTPESPAPPAPTASAPVTSASVPATGDAPLAPQSPVQVPAPATASGLGGCGGPGAGEGSPKGASGPALTGILASPFEISFAVTAAAATAPAAGSPTLSANDPATQPD
jgi:hypothetical protein